MSTLYTEENKRVYRTAREADVGSVDFKVRSVLVVVEWKLTVPSTLSTYSTMLALR